MPKIPVQDSVRSDRRTAAAICIVLTVLVWIVFGQTVRHGFVNFDDDQYVYENSHITAGLKLVGFKWFLTHSHASLWHPITTLSHMADCQIYGLNPAGHHFTNVLLHNLGTILLFLVLRAMTGRIWESGFVAAMFAIHPMRVESVAWVAERKDVLSGVFFMVSLGAYFYYTRKPSISRYVAMSIFVACGLMSKATFVTVPVVLLLLDYWPLARGGNFVSWQKRFVEKIPLFMLSAAAAAATVFAQTVTMATLQQLPLLPRLKNALVSLSVYLRETIWPTDLAVFYPHPHDQLSIWLVLFCAVLIIAITLLAIYFRQRAPYVLVGWFWFLILIAPVSGLIQAGLQARADRFTYLPHIGITIALTWSAADLTRKWRHRRLVLSSAAIAAVALAGLLSFRLTSFWRDSVSLWQHALAVTPGNQTAYQNLAAAFWSIGNVEKSRQASREGAIAHAQTTLKDYPFDIATHNDLGVLLLQTGSIRGAIAEWETSLRIDPNDGNALNNLAWVLATFPGEGVRDGKRAVDLAEKAAKIPGGNSPIVFRTLAAAYAEAGDFFKAAGTAQHALDLANAQHDASLPATLRHEIELYRTRVPYREAPSQ